MRSGHSARRDTRAQLSQYYHFHSALLLWQPRLTSQRLSRHRHIHAQPAEALDHAARAGLGCEEGARVGEGDVRQDMEHEVHAAG